jgi:hypothetical protein
MGTCAAATPTTHRWFASSRTPCPFSACKLLTFHPSKCHASWLMFRQEAGSAARLPVHVPAGMEGAPTPARGGPSAAGASSPATHLLPFTPGQVLPSPVVHGGVGSGVLGSAVVPLLRPELLVEKVWSDGPRRRLGAARASTAFAIAAGSELANGSVSRDARTADSHFLLCIVAGSLAGDTDKAAPPAKPAHPTTPGNCGSGGGSEGVGGSGDAAAGSTMSVLHLHFTSAWAGGPGVAPGASIDLAVAHVTVVPQVAAAVPIPRPAMAHSNFHRWCNPVRAGDGAGAGYGAEAGAAGAADGGVSAAHRAPLADLLPFAFSADNSKAVPLAPRSFGDLDDSTDSAPAVVSASPLRAPEPIAELVLTLAPSGGLVFYALSHCHVPVVVGTACVVASPAVASALGVCTAPEAHGGPLVAEVDVTPVLSTLWVAPSGRLPASHPLVQRRGVVVGAAPSAAGPSIEFVVSLEAGSDLVERCLQALEGCVPPCVSTALRFDLRALCGRLHAGAAGAPLAASLSTATQLWMPEHRLTPGSSRGHTVLVPLVVSAGVHDSEWAAFVGLLQAMWAAVACAEAGIEDAWTQEAPVSTTPAQSLAAGDDAAWRQLLASDFHLGFGVADAELAELLPVSPTVGHVMGPPGPPSPALDRGSVGAPWATVVCLEDFRTWLAPTFLALHLLYQELQLDVAVQALQASLARLLAGLAHALRQPAYVDLYVCAARTCGAVRLLPTARFLAEGAAPTPFRVTGRTATTGSTDGGLCAVRVPLACTCPWVPCSYLRDFGYLDANGFAPRREDVLGAPLPRAVGVLDWVRHAVSAWRSDLQPLAAESGAAAVDDLLVSVQAAHSSVFPRLRTVFRLFR